MPKVRSSKPLYKGHPLGKVSRGFDTETPLQRASIRKKSHPPLDLFELNEVNLFEVSYCSDKIPKKMNNSISIQCIMDT